MSTLNASNFRAAETPRWYQQILEMFKRLLSSPISLPDNVTVTGRITTNNSTGAGLIVNQTGSGATNDSEIQFRALGTPKWRIGNNIDGLNADNFNLYTDVTSKFVATVSTGGLLTLSDRVYTPGLGLGIRTVTSTTTALVTDTTILVDASGGAVVINLPSAASATKCVLFVKKIDSSANSVTIDGNGAETIDGAATLAWSTQWQSYTIQSNGTSWFIL